MKKCTKCHKNKDIKEFSEHKNYKDGYCSWCKSCQKENSRKWYEKNKTSKKFKKQRQDYYNSIKNDSDYLKKKKINYDKWLKLNLEHRSSYKKDYNKKYYSLNKEKIIRENIANAKAKLKTDLNFRLKKNLRTRIWEVLNRNSKSLSTIDLLGCSIEHFKLHLKSQFKEGMTWDNYGFYGWHIDHIKPCVKFDLTKPEEQKKCFHYTNLQPLWAEENLIKGEFYVGN